jgi:hypothetical protein
MRSDACWGQRHKECDGRLSTEPGRADVQKCDCICGHGRWPRPVTWILVSFVNRGSGYG